MVWSFFQEYAVDQWLSGILPENYDKLTLGMGTYGRSFTLTSSQTGVFAPASGAIAGPYTQEAGYWAYYDVRIIIFKYSNRMLVC